jgi:hypothetical protein
VRRISRVRPGTVHLSNLREPDRIDSLEQSNQSPSVGPQRSNEISIVEQSSVPQRVDLAERDLERPDLGDAGDNEEDLVAKARLRVRIVIVNYTRGFIRW